MSFVHEDPELPQLLAIVARETGVAAPLIEKDYWVTHCLWACHKTGLDLWLKGGTSLSKAFGLIQRFSEDLDLMVQHGLVTSLPRVSSWGSVNKGPIAQRRAFYDALPSVLAIPAVQVEIDESRRHQHARSADYTARYPGVFLQDLAPAMSPFVRLEIGRARVVPYVEMPLRSFVHDYLDQRGILGGYFDNRPSFVRCVHPVVTLLEKLDAIARRYKRDVMESDSFVRHYEDAAQIVRAADRLPALGTTPLALAEDMLAQRDIATLPRPAEPALMLEDASKRSEIARAYEKIGPMFWGPRIALDDACTAITGWLQKLHG